MTADMLATTYDTSIDTLCKMLAHEGFLYAPGATTKAIIEQQAPDALEDHTAFMNSWSNLSLDHYMADGGRYRKRRHSVFSALPSSMQCRLEPHQPHFQSSTYNHLNGNIERHYQPIDESVLHSKSLSSILALCCDVFSRLCPNSSWHIEVHQFRIEAASGELGMPTPEGVHRDGVNFVMMLMIDRINVVDGITSIYDTEKHLLSQFTLLDRFDMAMVNDERIFHGVTPIRQLNINQEAYRDMLVVTFREK
jgi:hypothetical protein